VIPRSLPAAALGAGALLLCAAAPSGAEAASSCPTIKPASVRIQPGAADTVSVSWKIPRRHPSRLAFRVTRDGAVVGQTTGRRVTVNVKPGTRPRIAVTAVVAGRLTHCRAVVTVDGAGSGATRVGAVAGLSARPDGTRRAKLSWDPSVVGSKPAASYRILRDGKVVRRTKHRTITVRLGKRAVRYQVAAVTRSGRVGPRSSVVVLKKGFVPPSRPTAPAVADATPTTVTMSWGASRAMHGRIAAYRVIRDGRTQQAVRGTSVSLPAVGPRTYRVVAVNSSGWASKASEPVTVEVGRRPPSAPGAPGATAVTDTSISLSWTPSQLPSGSKLRGYRVMRDGVIVTQVQAEAATVGNLAAKSSHDWSVAAVDTTGNVSASSPVSRIVQADPPPTAGAAQAFLLASTGSSFTAFRQHYRQIGVVYPTFFDCNRGSGAIEGNNDQQIVQFAQDRKVKVLPRFNCQSTSRLHQIFTDPVLRQQWLDGITARVEQYGYDGVNIDFETAAAADRDLMTSFIADLSDRLHARGKLMSQSVSGKTKEVANHPRSTAFNYPELAKYNDYIFVMAWGTHWSTSAPGTQDDIKWVGQVADYVATMPNKQKFVMGTMLYAMDWPAGGGATHPGAGLNAAELAQALARVSSPPAYDSAVGSWHATYQDDAGVTHDVWYSDLKGIGDRLAIARNRGLNIGFWRLGQEDDRLWTDLQLPTIG
jgi:spore germination protein YaaH